MLDPLWCRFVAILELVVTFVLFCASCSFITYYRQTCYQTDQGSVWKPPEASVAVAALLIAGFFLGFLLFCVTMERIEENISDKRNDELDQAGDGNTTLFHFVAILYWIVVILRGTLPGYAMDVVTFELKDPEFSGCSEAPTRNHLALVCIAILISMEMFQLFWGPGAPYTMHLILNFCVSFGGACVTVCGWLSVACTTIFGYLSVAGKTMLGWLAAAGTGTFDCFYTSPIASLRQRGQQKREVGPSAGDAVLHSINTTDEIGPRTGFFAKLSSTWHSDGSAARDKAAKPSKRDATELSAYRKYDSSQV